MGLYYGMADREPHPDAFRLRGKEWFEDAVGQLWRRFPVQNLEPEPKHHLGSLPTGSECSPCRSWTVRIASMAFMIRLSQYLLQLNAVAGHAWQIGCKFSM